MAKEYIERDAAIKYLEIHKKKAKENNFVLYANEDSIIKFLREKCPTADVVEVKHGEWKRKGQDIYCSVCGNESAYNPFGASKFSDYCPNCGAKMDGKE